MAARDMRRITSRRRGSEGGEAETPPLPVCPHCRRELTIKGLHKTSQAWYNCQQLRERPLPPWSPP